mmetsp:Transcript_18703/g.27079  ORF Transcript_18703/g.27079 Transcript_18703/m.27079 type:complete len:97 (-) Transcript_18703:478-768(-)
MGVRQNYNHTFSCVFLFIIDGLVCHESISLAKCKIRKRLRDVAVVKYSDEILIKVNEVVIIQYLHFVVFSFVSFSVHAERRILTFLCYVAGPQHHW